MPRNASARQWTLITGVERLEDDKLSRFSGYESPSALARTFRRKVGASPREWLQQNTA
ncbi:AraC family transcriptional regulator [Pseudomonas sp. TWI628]|uniref:AraC family transcriptional regulator n=1 Tax=Pseudomonas sp. TWI628 TaxID=3136788 RepID=UPI003209AC2C